MRLWNRLGFADYERPIGIINAADPFAPLPDDPPGAMVSKRRARFLLDIMDALIARGVSPKDALEFAGAWLKVSEAELSAAKGTWGSVGGKP